VSHETSLPETPATSARLLRETPSLREQALALSGLLDRRRVEASKESESSDMNGIIEILNVGTGDTKISFDKNNPADIERAKRIIPDMLKRGYALFCEVSGQLERVESFDPEREVYIVRLPWETEWQGEISKPEEPLKPAQKRRGRPRKAEVKLTEGKVVVVGRSAGG
jgi:hypothetical protein